MKRRGKRDQLPCGDRRRVAISLHKRETRYPPNKSISGSIAYLYFPPAQGEHRKYSSRPPLREVWAGYFESASQHGFIPLSSSAAAGASGSFR
jgi:hypothetical protein